MHIENYFPVSIGTVLNPNHNSIEENLVNYCISVGERTEQGGQDWISKDTYNTHGTHELSLDSNFSDINSWISSQVKLYADQLGYHDNFIINNSWFNIYQEETYQEKHTHPNSHISAIYYLKCNSDSAKTFFYNPYDDMCRPALKELTLYNFSWIHHNPIPGKLILFRSYIPHMVEKNFSNELRITLSYNFVQQKEL